MADFICRHAKGIANLFDHPPNLPPSMAFQAIFEKCLAIFDQAEVAGFVSKIDSDGAVFSSRVGRRAHVSPLCHQVSSADETR